MANADFFFFLICDVECYCRIYSHKVQHLPPTMKYSKQPHNAGHLTEKRIKAELYRLFQRPNSFPVIQSYHSGITGQHMN